MNLVNMKVDDSAGDMPMQSNYGYGLCLCLDDDQCEALGITNALPAGTIVMIQAKAIVKSATESVEQDGDDTGNDVRLEVQITDMALEPVGTAKNAAEILFGGTMS
jgi:hypothetical protein